METELKCPQCGSSNIKERFDGKKFCRDCGEILTACAKCGSYDIGTNKNGVLFCRDCGARGDELLTPVVQEEPIAKSIPLEELVLEPVPLEEPVLEPVPFERPTADSEISDTVQNDTAYTAAAVAASVAAGVASKAVQENEKNPTAPEQAEDITALICPQCGSTAISKRRDGLYYCDFCGTKILVHDDLLDTDEKGKETTVYGRTKSTVTEREFLRNALIDLAKNDDSPTDIFDAKFDDVKNEEIKVLVNDLTVDASYTVTIGTYRTEEYTVIEKKDVKYSKYANRPATSEEISRGDYVVVSVDTPVVKTRTVTDWSPFSGSSKKLNCARATMFLNEEENINEQSEHLIHERILFSLDFMDSYEGIDRADGILPVNSTEEKALQFNKATIDQVETLNLAGIHNLIRDSLPGDTSKDLHCDFSNDKSIRTALFSNRYILKYQYGGHYYDTYAFPFGNAKLCHKTEMEAGKSEKERMLWQATSKISILVTVLLGLSIVTSILIRSIIAVAVGFAAAVGLFIFDRINVNKKEVELELETKKVKLERLNKKLSELGLEKYVG